MTLQTTLVPTYYKDFKCLGTECSDTCCAGFTVPIDKDTYSNYEKSENAEFKPLFQKHLEKTNDPIFNNYGVIKMKKDCSCPFLDENKLCKIHSLLGENSLSTTCFTFPRKPNFVFGNTEKTLDLACPEAARLTLINEDGISFEEVLKEPGERENLIISAVNEQQIDQETFWDIRFFVIGLLQNRQYSLDDRLIILGFFIDSIKINLNNAAKIIQALNVLITNGSIKENLNQIQPDLKSRLLILNSLFEGLSRGTNNTFLDYVEKFKKGLELDKGSERLLSNFEISEQNFNRTEQSRSYILENYVVSYVFDTLFPFSNQPLSHSYSKLIIHYSLVKMILIGTLGNNEFLIFDDYVNVIYSYTKTVAHNTFLNEIINKHEINNLYILLKQ